MCELHCRCNLCLLMQERKFFQTTLFAHVDTPTKDGGYTRVECKSQKLAISGNEEIWKI